MANVRFVNADPNIGADFPDTQNCPKGHPWGHSPDCPWRTIQFSVDELAKVGGGTLYVATYQYNENVVMNGAKYSNISIIGELLGAITSPVDAQFCEQRPLLTAKNPTESVVKIECGANNMKLENLNISKGKHGVEAVNVNIMKLIACCVHDNTSGDEAGAGFLFDGCIHVLVKECRVFANKAMDAHQAGLGGGGTLAECNDVTIESSYFHSNEAKLAGGALRLQNCPKNSRVVIDDNIFGDKDAGMLAAGAVSQLANKADYGGAISIDECEDVDIRIGMTKANQHLANRANISGGAIAIEISTCRIGQDLFLLNRAEQNGGALYLHNGFDVRLRGTELQNNEAATGAGGGIFAAGEGHPNHAGPGWTIRPGKLFVTSARLRTNRAAAGLGGGLCANFNISVEIARSWFFQKNEAKVGGGVFFAGSQQNREVEITDCVFDDNIADDLGGGCHLNDAVATVRDSRFTNNVADKGGGVVFSGVNSPKATFALEHCEFWANQADDGGALFIRNTVAGSVQDNTVKSNQGGFYFLQDTIGALNFIHNRFSSNISKGGATLDIVSESDTSIPPVTPANLAAANFVNILGVIVK